MWQGVAPARPSWDHRPGPQIVAIAEMRFHAKFFSRANSVSDQATLLDLRMALVAALLTCSMARAEEKGLSYLWTLGSEQDVAVASPAHFSDVSRVGGVNAENGLAFRDLLPKVFQSAFIMPAFDFDPKLYGEGPNHPFYLTIHFKDIAKSPVTVSSYKGGGGFYGFAYAGTFGGTADGQWKDETIVIRRSILRSPDGQQYRFTLTDIAAPVPVASMLLFSAAAADLPDKAQRIEAAEAGEKARRQAVMAALLPKFTQVGLPDPQPAPALTPEETQAGYRVFFPPGPPSSFPIRSRGPMN